MPSKRSEGVVVGPMMKIVARHTLAVAHTIASRFCDGKESALAKAMAPRRPAKQSHSRNARRQGRIR